MTVHLFFGWEDVLVGLLLLVAVAGALAVSAVARADATGRAEWQAWLDARSSGRQDPATADRTLGPAEPDADPDPLRDPGDQVSSRRRDAVLPPAGGCR
jgi:hypothetical protein